MNVNVKDGGPAFPCLESRNAPNEGMSLRDWFAGQAMALRWPAHTLSVDRDGFVIDEDAVAVAVNCYTVADAMLKAREAV